ncbi:DUF4296 domain-containing protein [Mucilaginibacter pedocola]|uniref:DUF4296 domain-containing protein n=1 Tax=Mucilaginibacter pedocola TaxID=1792845 RepID=A0A1S9PLE7_9SPHI|nr:DUF4296 domain-containing protein [Mucilaginibacter pedocola]OOQ61767.1 hypothetical protein BC343_01470 [Mucilaginibacter pedocola]
MRNYIILFFSALVILTACKSKVPPGVIPQEQMVSLLTDVHLTDGGMYSIPQVPDSLYRYGKARYIALFKRHKTTSKALETSLKYYSTQPPELMAIYEQVSKNIQAKIDSLNKAGSPAKPSKPNAVPPQ